MVGSIPIPEGYAWILFEAALISFQVWFTGMGNTVLRMKIFNKAFYERHFPSFKGNKITTMDSGFPDTGTGRIADKLSDDEWFKFNNYQRAHMNYIEGVASVITALLVAGLIYTKLAFFAGLAYIIGRELYTQGYRRGGSTGRMIGVGILDLALIALWGMSIYGCFNAGGGVPGLIKMFKF